MLYSLQPKLPPLILQPHAESFPVSLGTAGHKAPACFLEHPRVLCYASRNSLSE